MADHVFQPETLAIHAGQIPDAATGARALPIYQTTSYVFDDVDHAASLFNLHAFGHLYTRVSNPTVSVLQVPLATSLGLVADSNWGKDLTPQIVIVPLAASPVFCAESSLPPPPHAVASMATLAATTARAFTLFFILLPPGRRRCRWSPPPSRRLETFGNAFLW